MDYREKLREDQTGLRALVAKIPGFRGYAERDLRREADKLLRLYIADGLQAQRNRLTEVQVQLTEAKQLAAVGQVERSVTKLQRLIDRLKTASYGYAGWFDAVAVRTEELDRLYQYDYTLVAGLDDLATKVDDLAKAVPSGDIAAASAALAETLEALNATLDVRGQVVTQV